MPDSVPAGGLIELRGVSKHYGISQDRQVAAADEVTLTIEAGAFVALTGASGSGKSTLLHLIGAIERPDSGTIVSGGTEITALRGAPLAAYRRTVGFVFQRYNLLAALRDEHQMTIVLASHDPQIATRSERLIRLRDGAVVDDIDLTEEYPAEDVIRHAGRLG